MTDGQALSLARVLLRARHPAVRCGALFAASLLPGAPSALRAELLRLETDDPDADVRLLAAFVRHGFRW